MVQYTGDLEVSRVLRLASTNLIVISYNLAVLLSPNDPLKKGSSVDHRLIIILSQSYHRFPMINGLVQGNIFTGNHRFPHEIWGFQVSIFPWKPIHNGNVTNRFSWDFHGIFPYFRHEDCRRLAIKSVLRFLVLFRKGNWRWRPVRTSSRCKKSQMNLDLYTFFTYV